MFYHTINLRTLQLITEHFLHIAHEEGLLLEGKNMHAGIRT